MRVPCLKMETGLTIETLCVRVFACVHACICARVRVLVRGFLCVRVCVLNTGNKNPPLHWSPKSKFVSYLRENKDGLHCRQQSVDVEDSNCHLLYRASKL
jgi:hypothetical protein